MIELLVALALLTLGIVGIAELQATALKLNHGAYLRSQANNLIYDIIDAMRANRTAALDEAYVWDIGGALPAASAGSVALQDIRHWLLNIENTMRPYNGTGGIEQDEERFSVTIRWVNRVESEGLAEDEVQWDQLSVVTAL